MDYNQLEKLLQRAVILMILLIADIASTLVTASHCHVFVPFQAVDNMKKSNKSYHIGLKYYTVQFCTLSL